MSVIKATKGLQAEIIVVDNNSVDGSQKMVRDKFAETVLLIENRDNPGFSKANNQGIREATGKYVLLLNPDTVVEENTFIKCFQFMNSRPDVGALGVKMIDGQGKFLPESKRALPTPWVSFYKIFGFSALFPKSRRFGKYHLSYLDKDQNHEIEILSGAFMWMRMEVLDKIGLLDETFFMYGEDVDLSYRVIQAGYKNYYFAETQIIHYKGESTKKGSLNYVRVFYNAMIIFAEKHFGGNQKRLFISAIRLAVYVRALAAILNRIIKKMGFPLIEMSLIYAIMFGIKVYWEHYVKYIEGGAYPAEFTWAYMPIYTILFVFCLWLMGGYKKPYRLRPLIVGPIVAFIAIATATYMFSGIQNFSRGIVGLSSVFTMVIAMATRGIINYRENGSFFFTESTLKRVAIVGEPVGAERITRLIQGELDYPVDIVGSIVPETESISNESIEILGTIEQLNELGRFYDIDELIFCNQSLPTKKILDLMTEVEGIEYKIVPPKADYVVGPQIIHTSRYNQQILFNLQKSESRLEKRVFDLVMSAGLLVTYPLLFWLYEKPIQAGKRLLQVLFQKYHLVGYIHPESPGLPRIKPGLLNMLDRANGSLSANSMNTGGLDKYYARTYRWDMDLKIVLKGWRRID